MFRRLLLVLALASTTACAPLSARDLVEVDVIDRDNGQWLPEYRHRGDSWIAGVPGHRYSVRLTNTTGQRVLVVLSVDGVNAVSGQTAAPSQAGYVLAPWESAEIAGWRKSMDDVAQFLFTDLPDSYAARTGRPADVGVIGIAVFRERVQPRQTPARPARGWKVHVPAFATREEANAMGEKIKAAGIADWYVMNAGGDANSIALGRYASEDAARRRESELTSKGIPAQAEPLGDTAAQAWLEARLPAAADRAALAAIAPAKAVDCAPRR